MESALTTVAQWAGSAIITKLIETAYTYLGKCMLLADTESQLSRLKAALPKIKAVMSVAEVLKFKHPNSGVNEWLEQFKEAFLAAEDVLDELKYRELEDKVKKQDQVSGFFCSKLDWLKSKIHISCHGCCRGYTISKDTFRLREAVKMLDLVAADVGNFFQFTTTLDFHGLAKSNIDTSSRETTSLFTVSNVFGRENEKAMIIEWLKKPASHGNISAFCIVGVGGLGKTTLAQLIFEEISKENYFDKTIWVCVSTSFSVEDITRKILDDLGEKSHICGESLNGLQKSLKERIFSKKFFLILDDVWNDDKICDWENLIVPLERHVQQGSKILLTTRMESVADMLARVLNAVNVERETLKGLKEQELLQLFNKYAFSGYNPDNHKDLQKIGNDTVKKLRDSPLAAKVIGSLLNSNMDIHYWKRILNQDSLINLEQAKDVADVLKLSYYHLPAHLQECFRFCCIFPQDYCFDKDELIKMWISSGFIRQELHGEVRPEDICKEYFNNLFRKSFFERHSWANNTYVMHNLMHDLAQNVSEGECCRVEPNGKSDNIPRTAQHVSVPESKIERILNLRNLRTLVITLSYDPNRDRFVLPNGSLKETLHLLVIQGGRCELPEEIGSLLHLRFLKVNLYKLPNSIYKLYQLQVLEMSDDYSHIEGVETTGMTNLVSLRYLKLPDEVMQNIHGVHKLTSLQELDFFVGRESGHHIDELQMLNNLRSLSIYNLENVENPDEVMNANLSKKESLISLFLIWTWNNSDNPEHEQVIDNLRPHPNLKELTIWGYVGHKYPIWMMDSSHLDLSSLTLTAWHCCEALLFLGQMPYLKKLSLKQMYEVKEVDYSCDSTNDCAFPSLEQLYCSNMPKWESWAGPLSCYGFPNLKELLIDDCLNLAKLPAIPFSLMKFKIENVGLNSLPDMHYGCSITDLAPSYMKSSLKVVKIINCPKLISLDGFLQQQNLDLQAVEELTIQGCENLLQLPTERFGKLMSLKYLTIENNPQLAAVAFWRNLIPVKLHTLTMGNCGELDVPLLGSSFCLTNLTELWISGSATITSITSMENAFPSLKHLNIQCCPNLTKFPNLPLSLEIFYIEDVALSDLPEYFQSSCSDGPTSSSLIASLRYVSIGGCSHLASLNGFLLQENIDISGLEALAIVDCENLVQLPTDAVGKFVSLKRLVIKGCPKLVELSSMHQANTVNPGNNLICLKINSLEVDHPCLLLIEPLRSFRFVSYLTVDKCSGLEALPEQWLLQNSSTLRALSIYDASSLRSLPGTMVMLTSLEELYIYNATLLEEIPELPTSLISKIIERDETSATLLLHGCETPEE